MDLLLSVAGAIVGLAIVGLLIGCGLTLNRLTKELGEANAKLVEGTSDEAFDNFLKELQAAKPAPMHFSASTKGTERDCE